MLRFSIKKTATMKSSDLTSACSCGAVIGDYYLHRPGEALWPTIAEEHTMEKRKLTFDRPTTLKASPSVGIAERVLEESLY